MTLKDYIENLYKFAKENPECLEMEVITSKDVEGNGFNKVYFTPTKGVFDNGDFISEEGYDDYGYKNNDTNIVCVN